MALGYLGPDHLRQRVRQGRQAHLRQRGTRTSESTWGSGVTSGSGAISGTSTRGHEGLRAHQVTPYQLTWWSVWSESFVHQ